MAINDSDRDWEALGKRDPYFAVLTAPEFHGALTKETRQKFFASGEAHVDTIFSIVKQSLDPSFAPRRALDFGCGVGRLLIPIAARCQEVVGVDVSPSMLAEARRNCDEAGVTNVRLVQGDDEVSGVSGQFDLVHSYIVLQHIPVDRGERIVRRLASLIGEDGVGVIQAPYTTGRKEILGRTIYWARMHLPGARQILNLALRRSPSAPVMQMNAYSVTRLVDLLRDAGCADIHVRFSDHDGARGVLLFARKSNAPIFL